MLLVALAVVAGVVAGRLAPSVGGRHRRLVVRWVPVLVAGVLATGVADRLDGDVALPLAVAGRVALLAGVLANAHLAGVGVLAVGLALNLAPLLVDGATPVRRGALVAAGVVDADEVDRVGFDGPRRLESDADRVAVLGDVLPLEPVGAVSFGDLVTAVGVADVAGHLVRRRRRPTGRPAATAPARGPVAAASLPLRPTAHPPTRGASVPPVAGRRHRPARPPRHPVRPPAARPSPTRVPPPPAGAWRAPTRAGRHDPRPSVRPPASRG